MKKFIVSVVALMMLMTAAVVAESPYIGNKSSKRFHYYNCPSVAEMHPYNKVEIYSRDEAINAGYVPCKRCKP